MKRNLLKLALCAMAALPLGAWAQEPWYGTEKVVNEATTWTFEGWATADNIYTDNTAWRVENKLYARSISGGNYSVKEIGSTTPLAFSDGTNVNVTKYLQTNTAASVGNTSTVKTAGQTSTNDVTPLFAFNASVPGTVYVYIQEVGESHNTGYRQRIYVADPTLEGDNAGFRSAYSNEGAKGLGIEEIKYVSPIACSYAIGSTGSACRIYAIRFVPINESITIGSTGYATYANNTGVNLSVPSGLTVYRAKPADSSVTLVSLDGIPKGAGVVLKGTPNTPYSLTPTKTVYSNSSNYMRPVTADMTLPASEGGYYHYILANDNGTAKFFHVNGTSTISKGKAYLRVTNNYSSTSARGISIIFEDDETTGITSTKVEKGDDSWYTLQGVKVAQPTKGIYVKNGKKVVVK